MTLRMDYKKEFPEAFQAMLRLEKFVAESGIDHTLLELIKLRASQINGCAFCLNMHAQDARSQGESEQRIYLLNAWREAPYYTDAERAALALTEAVTRISEAGVPQAIYDEARRHFDGKQFTAILMAINTINCWNRLAITTGMMPN
ncbi:carboxymuconolactone decarboxylase family protein [Paenibacillus sedimenti]|uniref:Carboxymuconolactone decarboxylase family protein n=1 Tax=Paenibacillus sedimenti TaxID=2770274 RepID=A0A926KTL0_9BACL|nr:carboxymuconolactone decarboxylase family protein [Paenibacillus sedimenti]MBD0383058.1 carboxymuconolactone decarboxylase family protein [Paenibacillus sedimenti]